MLKSLFATCLTAFSVNTQPLAVSPSIEPSRAISGDTTFNIGDYVRLDLVTTYYYVTDFVSFDLLSNGDSGTDTLSIVSCEINGAYIYSRIYAVSEGFEFDYCECHSSMKLSENIGTNYTPIEFDDSTDNGVGYIGCSFTENVIRSTTTSSVVFEILEGFEGFSTEALPYLTKVEKPYTPPAKSNLYRLLYDFYYSIFNDEDLTAISTGYNMPFDNWLAHTCTIATLITLIVVAFFFLRWLFKVISGLILLKR